MYTKVHIQNIHKTNITANGNTFEVCYINTNDGRSYTAYTTTPGYSLLKEDIDLVLYYKTNIKNGKTYFNVFNITDKVPHEDATTILKDIRDTLQNMLIKLEEQSVREPVVGLQTTTVQKDSDLPF